MRLHLITAEDRLTLDLRARELIRFPQLTMPLLAALTPPERAKRHFYSPGQILKRMAISGTGLWWNIPRNVGYMLGTTREAGARRAGEPAPEDRLLGGEVLDLPPAAR